MRYRRWIRRPVCWRWVVPLFLVLASSGWLSAQSDQQSAADPILTWLDQLDADQFVVREEATLKLVERGREVIDPLVEKISQMRTAEGRLRCVFVLKQLALSDDDQVQEAAERALEKIQQMPLGTVARKAGDSLQLLYALRQRRALQELVRLGAKPLPERTLQVEFVYGLQLDDSWQGTDHDVRQLRYMVNLQYLTLTGSKVRDSWLVHLPPLQDLHTLSINRAAVTSAGLQQITQLPNLKILEIKYVPIGDESIEWLSRLKNADTLKLYGTAITPAGAERLRQALPLVRVDLRAGAFLGISGDHHSLGCLVHTVRPNTAASQIGLQPGDIIIRYAGKRVGDFEALTALISQNRPGDEVEIQFVRGTDAVSVTRVRRPQDETPGLVTREHPVGCEVTDVKADSLAALAGLRPGDVVHRVNGELVERPEQLERQFGNIGVGQFISFDFARGISLYKVVARLGEWE
ncbi:MAG: hypothetical protein KatS3mg110_3910 [Pirellulaceae bacterium]|nr:MAG: hypothetical protein KatS3mg110_3910 [Pirellulaceae bacterium]